MNAFDNFISIVRKILKEIGGKCENFSKSQYSLCSFDDLVIFLFIYFFFFLENRKECWKAETCHLDKVY